MANIISDLLYGNYKGLAAKYRDLADYWQKKYEEEEKRKWEILDKFPSIRFVYGDYLTGIVEQVNPLYDNIPDLKVGVELTCEYDNKRYVICELSGFEKSILTVKLKEV